MCVCVRLGFAVVSVSMYFLWMQEGGGYVHGWGRGLGVRLCVRVSVCAEDKDLANRLA